MSKHIFISTAIPYVNASPHMGFAFELVLADIIARYYRARGDHVFFLSGTDDNALKNVQAAERAGVSVQSFVNKNAERFKDLTDSLNISNDYFIRTSVDDKHRRGAQKLWRSVDRGDIYKKKYGGLYCVGCEEFKTEKDLQGGECPEHPGASVERIEEDNYFFRLTNYSTELTNLIESGTLAIIPQSRRNETLSFISGGLEDFSVSRSVARAKGWGISVPNDDTQIQYVWFDALSNYINALGYADGGKDFNIFWERADRIIHVVGKGINRFHTVYWPAMLMSAGIRVPDTVLVHGYITTHGQKMSKSLGNVVDPMDIVKEYGVDALRYYLAREITPFEDGDFTTERFRETYNANLANGLGNLAARILKMAETYLDEPVTIQSKKVNDFAEYCRYLDTFEISKAADFVWEKIGDLDAHIAKTEPFKMIKEKPDEARGIVTDLVRGLYEVAILLEPILPETAQKIKKGIEGNTKPETLFLRK